MGAFALPLLLLSAIVVGANSESLSDELDAIVPESFLATEPADQEIKADAQDANADDSFAKGDGFSVEDAFDSLVKNTADKMSDVLRPPAFVGTPSKDEL